MHSITNKQSPEAVIRNLAEQTREYVSQFVFGHDEATRMLFGAFVIGAHALIEGPPGIAKTLLARTFARSLNLDFRRIQFTPDLMPSDITGISIFDPRSNEFRFSPGPLFTDIVLADEINRTPPKTQAALLEAMQECQVTIDGERHPLSPLFFVIATQNPIEHEGTFPLPEAQLDRFLFKLKLTYPEKTFETSMIERLSSSIQQEDEGESKLEVSPNITLAEWQNARAHLREITLSPAMSDYITRLVSATRNHPNLLLGASPRAGLFLALSAKVSAALSGRNYTIPDDVKAMAHPVLDHRLVLRPESYDLIGDTAEIVDEAISRTPVPSEA